MVNKGKIMNKKVLFFIMLIMVNKIVGISFDIKLTRRPLKILCALRTFPVLSEVFIINQLTGFVDRGHDLSIYAMRSKQNMVHPVILKYNLLDCTYYNLPPDIHDYDIIICQFGTLGQKFVEIKKNLGLKAKIITCFRGYDISREIKEKGKHIYDSLFEKGDYFLPVCNYFRNILIELGCPEHKIRVHHSAVDFKKFVLNDKNKTSKEGNRDNEKITIVSVNRLVPKKGTIYSIRAIVSLLKKYPQIQYLIMGDGPLHDDLMNAIHRYGAADNIKLLGWGNHDDVLRLLNQADIFVLASMTDKEGNEEGIPNCLKEAMSVGIPVVSTDHAGINELVEDGKTGFLVRSKFVLGLAKKIEYLIKNRQEARAMGIAAHDHVQLEYDTEKLNDQLIEIFYSLLD